MLELTTGVVFLMSSLYGSGQKDHQIQTASVFNTANTAEKTETVTNEQVDESTLIKNPKAMEAYLREKFADTPILVDIARCESNFRQFDDNGNIVRGRVNPEDIGLLQINEKYQGATAKKLGLDIYTIEGNIAYAKHLYEEQGTQPWVYSSKCWAGNDLARNK